MIDWRAGTDWRYRRCTWICLICLLAYMFVLYFSLCMCLCVFKYVCLYSGNNDSFCQFVCLDQRFLILPFFQFSLVRFSCFISLSVQFHVVPFAGVIIQFTVIVFIFCPFDFRIYFCWIVFHLYCFWLCAITFRSSPPFASLLVHSWNLSGADFLVSLTCHLCRCRYCSVRPWSISTSLSSLRTTSRSSSCMPNS